MKNILLGIVIAASAALAINQYDINQQLRDANANTERLRNEVRTLTRALGEVNATANGQSAGSVLLLPANN